MFDDDVRITRSWESTGYWKPLKRLQKAVGVVRHIAHQVQPNWWWWHTLIMSVLQVTSYRNQRVKGTCTWRNTKFVPREIPSRRFLKSKLYTIQYPNCLPVQNSIYNIHETQTKVWAPVWWELEGTLICWRRSSLQAHAATHGIIQVGRETEEERLGKNLQVSK